MNWKLKAWAHIAFSHMPFGEYLNYLSQRWVTHTLPLDDSAFQFYLSTGLRHIDFLRKHWGGRIEDAIFYEFGAGWHLLTPLAFYSLGVGKQIVVDVQKRLRIELVNSTIETLQRLPAGPHLVRRPSRLLERKDEVVANLREYYGIDYRAPFDARKTCLVTGSVDCITSTVTLEHISPVDIEAILQECYRILKDDGLISFCIDYQDHYAFFDRHISSYNFYRYSEKVWRIFSPPSHYQNRLTHKDYLRIFQATGFVVLEERRREGTLADLQRLKKLPLNERFRSYTLEELAVRGGDFVLRKSRAESDPDRVERPYAASAD